MNHSTAELPFAFRVNSTPSSSTTGRSVSPVAPMIATSTYSTAALFGLTVCKKG